MFDCQSECVAVTFSAATTYAYDANGNPQSASNGVQCTYNPRNQTTSLLVGGEYDAFGNITATVGQNVGNYFGADPINLSDPQGTSIFDSPFADDVKRVVTSPFAKTVGKATRVSFPGWLGCYGYKSMQSGDTNSLGDDLSDAGKCTPAGFFLDDGD